MKRSRILLLALCFIGGIAAALTLRNQQPAATGTLGSDRFFKVEDVDRIGRIYLVHRDGETVDLKRQGRSWVFNDAFRARPNAMENLLNAIGSIQMKYKPAEAAVDNMVRDLATHGIKVEIYDREGESMKTYYVGGGTADERGTHVIMDGAEQPYVAHLPGWEGNLRFRYNLRGDDWRDKSVFAEEHDQVTRISVEYPRQKDKSFVLEKNGRNFTIEPFYPTTPKAKVPQRAGRAEAYLYEYESVVAEAFENDNPRQDSIRQSLPFSIIRVARTDGSTKEVRLWPVRPLVTMWESAGETPQQPVERYFAGTDKGDFFLVQHRVFRRILTPYSAFFAEAEE